MSPDRDGRENRLFGISGNALYPSVVNALGKDEMRGDVVWYGKMRGDVVWYGKMRGDVVWYGKMQDCVISYKNVTRRNYSTEQDEWNRFK